MFNLEDYEPVEERLTKFIKDFPDFRLETELVAHTHDRYIVKASLYRTYADNAPYSTGLAEETVSSRGVNSTSALENCETSAIGRALANAGYATKGKRASREEMAKVNANKPKPFAEKLAEKITMVVEDDPWTVKAVDPAAPASMSVDEVAKAIGATVLTDDPTCKHGNRIWATGTSKTGKVWGHWKCDASPMNGQRWADVDKCDPLWCDLSPKGTWTIRVDK
jgi:hypothetical protein